MNPIIYYRKSLMDADELTAAQKHFKCVDLITDIPEDSLVIPRYSMMPFYNDQEREIKNLKSQLINDCYQHAYVADLQNYVYDLKELTPRTWTSLQDLPDNVSFVLKGETNSRKAQWLKSMFAQDKQAAVNVYNELTNDSLIGYQKIYIREYVPLFKYLEGINGMPVTREFRFFVAYDNILCGDYYWQNYVDDLPERPNPKDVPLSFLQEVISRVGSQCNFYTIDVGQTIHGDWIVIELNDGIQAGLSCNDPNFLYENLDVILRTRS